MTERDKAFWKITIIAILLCILLLVGPFLAWLLVILQLPGLVGVALPV